MKTESSFLKGEELHRVLENGVFKYNEGGGRFPQVSGIFFAFDPKKSPGQRIDPKLIKINDKYIDMEQVGTSFELNFVAKCFNFYAQRAIKLARIFL